MNFRSGFLSFIALFAFASVARADGTTARPELQNFRVIAPGIFAGANPIFIDTSGPHDNIFANLADVGVKTVIDLQGTDVSEAPNFAVRIFNEWSEPGERPENIARERQLAENAGMRFINLPINSNNHVDADEAKRIHAALEIIEQATPENPVYVHCQHGADRTGLVVALARLLILNPRLSPDARLSIDQINDEWTRFGHTGKARFFTGHLDTYFCSIANKFSASSFCGPLQK